MCFQKDQNILLSSEKFMKFSVNKWFGFRQFSYKILSHLFIMCNNFTQKLEVRSVGRVQNLECSEMLYQENLTCCGNWWCLFFFHRKIHLFFWKAWKCIHFLGSSSFWISDHFCAWNPYPSWLITITMKHWCFHCPFKKKLLKAVIIISCSFEVEC